MSVKCTKAYRLYDEVRAEYLKWFGIWAQLGQLWSFLCSSKKNSACFLSMLFFLSLPFWSFSYISFVHNNTVATLVALALCMCIGFALMYLTVDKLYYFKLSVLPDLALHLASDKKLIPVLDESVAMSFLGKIAKHLGEGDHSKKIDSIIKIDKERQEARAVKSSDVYKALLFSIFPLGFLLLLNYSNKGQLDLGDLVKFLVAFTVFIFVSFFREVMSQRIGFREFMERIKLMSNEKHNSE